ncbi:MAG TPA: hypothetical protein ACHBX0_03005 [Arsenophonus sp.]
MGKNIHGIMYEEKLRPTQHLLLSTSLPVNEISTAWGYPSLQYFYSIKKKRCWTNPKRI